MGLSQKPLGNDKLIKRAKDIYAEVVSDGKSGFVVAKTKDVFYHADPDADYFLIKELIPGFLDQVKEASGGTFKEPDGYFIDSKQAEEFDSQFPPKEKLSLPGQIFG